MTLHELLAKNFNNTSISTCSQKHSLVDWIPHLGQHAAQPQDAYARRRKFIVSSCFTYFSRIANSEAVQRLNNFSESHNHTPLLENTNKIQFAISSILSYHYLQSLSHRQKQLLSVSRDRLLDCQLLVDHRLLR